MFNIIFYWSINLLNHVDNELPLSHNSWRCCSIAYINHPATPQILEERNNLVPLWLFLSLLCSNSLPFIAGIGRGKPVKTPEKKDVTLPKTLSGLGSDINLSVFLKKIHLFAKNIKSQFLIVKKKNWYYCCRCVV